MPNLPRVMLRAPLRVVAWTLLLQVGLAAPDVAPPNAFFGSLGLAPVAGSGGPLRFLVRVLD
jgi:hypothetical protein